MPVTAPVEDTDRNGEIRHDWTRNEVEALQRDVLDAWGYPWLDGQVPNPHLSSTGAILVSRERFIGRLEELVALPGRTGPWTKDFAETLESAPRH